MILLHVILAIVKLYALLGLAFLGAMLCLGLAGKEETILPRPLAGLLRLMAWPWLRGWATGVTVGVATVFPISDPHEPLRVHEATHRAQTRRQTPSWKRFRKIALLVGTGKQIVLYVRDYLRHGYVKNVYEVEARKAAGEE